MSRAFIPEIGSQVTVHFYSDAQSHTVIDISKSGRVITIQRDAVERLTDPHIIPGGFAGHCTNQRSIEYKCTPDENGATMKFSKRDLIDGSFRWVKVGDSVHNGMSISEGSHEFYDYNF